MQATRSAGMGELQTHDHNMRQTAGHLAVEDVHFGSKPADGAPVAFGCLLVLSEAACTARHHST